jgi:putative redox protein
MAIRMKTEVTLKAQAHCPSHSRADISVRDLTFAIDEPVERGGTNAGPTPTDTALSPLVGCTNVIGHKCADKLGVDIGHLDISARCTFDRRGVTLQEEIDVPFRSPRISARPGPTPCRTSPANGPRRLTTRVRREPPCSAPTSRS